jgi:hypothetical protein
MARVNPDHPKLKRFGDKHRDYFRFAEHLVNEGDYIVTDILNSDERNFFRIKVLWWAQRNNKVVKTEVIYLLPEDGKPGGKAMKATLTRNYRYKTAGTGRER